MSRKTIWLNPPLERLAAQNSQEGNFSRRLGDIVERYDVIMALAAPVVPELTPGEHIILKDLLTKSKHITAPFIQSMPEYIDSIVTGTVADRDALKAKIEDLSPTVRIAFIEMFEKNQR